MEKIVLDWKNEREDNNWLNQSMRKSPTKVTLSTCISAFLSTSEL